MIKNYQQFTQQLTSLILQPCTLCGDSGYKNLCLCNACLRELPYIDKCCQRCGIPLSTDVTCCGHCQSNPPPNARCISLLHYQEPVDYLIKHMKYHNQLSIAALLGDLLGRKISQLNSALPEQIIPVPLHLHRLQQRGYNQAIEIARVISKILNIPINTKDYIRQRNTAPQFDLPHNQRADNIKQAFEVSHAPSAKHVAIIDDVMTTGSTAWELCQTILDSGVESVDIWICARASIS